MSTPAARRAQSGPTKRNSPAPKPTAGASWRVSFASMSLPMRVLRLMLGVTFLYGGIYKALDATFLDPKSTGYIGAQLRGFSLGSPISGILLHLIEHASLVGWATMLTEFALGIAVLVGVWLFPAAIGGAALSLGLWLSASWHVTPYFLTSDPAYLAMWIAFGVGVLPQRSVRKELESLVERRSLLQAASVGALAVIGAVVLKPFASGPAKAAAASATPSASGTATATGAAQGTKVTSLSNLAVGDAVNFTASDGNPAVVIRTATDKVCAYSTICTHQGCPVTYDPGSKDLICPCHGAAYDPSNHAAVLQGPAPQPLQEYTATISGNDVYVA
jgi:thiosulfate dehydrogenase [quinone] large subunit